MNLQKKTLHCLCLIMLSIWAGETSRAAEPTPIPAPASTTASPSKEGVIQPLEHYDQVNKPNPFEAKTLEQGRLGVGRRIGGGIVGTTIGFGIGHAIAGVYDHYGSMFTYGELFGALLAAYGAATITTAIDCHTVSSSIGCTTTTTYPVSIFIGAAFFGIFRIWEIVDVWVAPVLHNSRYDEISAKKRANRTSFNEPRLSLEPTLAQDGGGIQLGLHF